MDIRWKSCGLRSPEDIKTVNEVRPDYAGFIVEVPKSFRSVSIEILRELSGQLDENIRAVGVFVDAPVEKIEKLLNEQVIDLAQLHGNETSEEIRYLQEKTGKKIIKAFSVQTKEDIERALKSPADYILLDQGSGGTGKTFDWSLVGHIERPWFLAGGLHAGNLSDAIKRLHPWAVDISSGIETEKKKDPEKIRRIKEIMAAEGRR